MISIRNYLKLIRIKHWIKNVFVFAPIFFSGDFFNISLLLDASLVFISFCFISSAIYCINDTIDINSDKLHPIKKNRPLASGSISLTSGIVLCVILFSLSAFISINVSFLSLAFIFTYFLINIAYSLLLKTYPIIDVICISSGFVLRMLSGTPLVSDHPSNWIFLTTFFLSLFLGFSKRRCEFSNSIQKDFDPNITRKVLKDYSINALDNIIASLMSITIICYSLYTVSSEVSVKFGNNNLIYTIPPVVYCMFYYFLLLVRERMSEDHVEVFVQSKPIQLAVFIWASICFTIIYEGV